MSAKQQMNRFWLSPLKTFNHLYKNYLLINIAYSSAHSLDKNLLFSYLSLLFKRPQSVDRQESEGDCLSCPFHQVTEALCSILESDFSLLHPHIWLDSRPSTKYDVDLPDTFQKIEISVWVSERVYNHKNQHEHKSQDGNKCESTDITDAYK